MIRTPRRALLRAAAEFGQRVALIRFHWRLRFTEEQVLAEMKGAASKEFLKAYPQDEYFASLAEYFAERHMRRLFRLKNDRHPINAHAR